jgi:hypothetical protein
MEALGYMFAFFALGGKLPWMGLRKMTRNQKEMKVIELKRDFPFSDMFPGYPIEFVEYMRICRSLEFEQKPNYN